MVARVDMVRIVFNRTGASLLAAIFALSIALGGYGRSVLAAELKLFISMDRDVLDVIVPEFEKVTGHTIALQVGFASSLEQRISAGEAYDAVIATSDVIDRLVRQGKILADSHANVARSGIGVAVKSGMPKPDITTANSFRISLIEAKSIGYIDPKTGGVAGVYVAQMLDRLGIAAEVKSKTNLFPRPPVLLASIAAGETMLGITQTNRILAAPGVQLVGPLPQELQVNTTFTAGIPVGSKERDAALTFIKFVTSPDAAPMLKAKGLEPGQSK